MNIFSVDKFKKLTIKKDNRWYYNENEFPLFQLEMPKIVASQDISQFDISMKFMVSTVGEEVSSTFTYELEMTKGEDGTYVSQVQEVTDDILSGMGQINAWVEWKNDDGAFGKTGSVVVPVYDHITNSSAKTTPIRDGGSGTSTNVKVDGVSITNNGIANIKTTGGYSNTNKIVLEDKISGFALVSESGNKITLECDNEYKLIAKLFNKNDTLLSTSNVIDLPIESMIVNVTYDSTNKKLVLTLQNGTTVDVPLGDIVSGLATQTWVKSQGYLTQHQSLEGYATEEWVEQQEYMTTIPNKSVDETKISTSILDSISEYVDLLPIETYNDLLLNGSVGSVGVLKTAQNYKTGLYDVKENDRIKVWQRCKSTSLSFYVIGFVDKDGKILEGSYAAGTISGYGVTEVVAPIGTDKAYISTYLVNSNVLVEPLVKRKSPVRMVSEFQHNRVTEMAESSQVKGEFRKPLISFIDDDGYAKYDTYLKKYVEDGIKICPAVYGELTYPMSNNYLSVPRLLELQKQGIEILGHADKPADGLNVLVALGLAKKENDVYYWIEDETPVPDDFDCTPFQEQYINQGYDNLREFGLEVDGFVYASGLSDLGLRQATQHKYNYAFMTERFKGLANDGIIYQYGINRVAIGGYYNLYNPDKTIMSEDDIVETLKGYVDDCIENKTWLVFLSHAWMMESGKSTKPEWQNTNHISIFKQLIDYVKEKIGKGEVEVVNPRDAIKSFGNAIQYGDYFTSNSTDCLVVSKQGEIYGLSQGGGTEYTSGDGINITDNEISVDDTIAKTSDIPTDYIPKITREGGVGNGHLVTTNADGTLAYNSLTALQIAKKTDIPDVSTKEDASNKTTILSQESTDAQYPSAKSVVDYVASQIGTIETSLDSLISGGGVE